MRRDLDSFQSKCRIFHRSWMLYPGTYLFRKYVFSPTWCHYSMFHVSIALAFIGIFLNTGCISFLAVSKMKLSRKYQHLLFLDIANMLIELAFISWASQGGFFPAPSRIVCVSVYIALSAAGFTFGTALVSLSTDCLLAVFFPLRYRTMVTTRRTVVGISIPLCLFLVLMVIFPIAAFGFKHADFIVMCSPKYMFPNYFLVITGVISAIVLVTILVLNVSILIGAVQALSKRKKLTGASASIQKNVLKLAARLMAIILFNLSFSGPLVLLGAGIKFSFLPFSICYLLFILLGIFNNIVYFFGDKQIRKQLASSCCSK